jgi:hypothetical protein
MCHARWLIAVLAALLGSCSNPADIGVPRIVIPSPIDTDEDDPRFDTLTASFSATFRFEAAVDTTQITIDRFTGTGLRIALLAIHPDSASDDSFLSLYTVSANYLDRPAIGLPLSIQIPAGYFKRYKNARLATALVVLFEDRDDDGRYSQGERMFGACEQQLFGLAEGKRLKNIPSASFGDIREGPNVLVRTSQDPFPGFQSAPDFQSTIFIIQVRGPLHRYNYPYPWPIRRFLFP